jgi:flagellar biosynthesis/type III secretory pathway chaperone
MRQHSFEEALRQACACLQQFIELLEQERDALPSASAEQIEELASRKRQHLEQLREMFSNSPSQPDPKQDKTVIKALAEQARKASRQAHTLNRANGRLLAARARFVDASLDTLAGAAGKPRTYGADGSLTMLHRARYAATA